MVVVVVAAVVIVVSAVLLVDEAAGVVVPLVDAVGVWVSGWSAVVAGRLVDVVVAGVSAVSGSGPQDTASTAKASSQGAARWGTDTVRSF